MSNCPFSLFWVLYRDVKAFWKKVKENTNKFGIESPGSVEKKNKTGQKANYNKKGIEKKFWKT